MALPVESLVPILGTLNRELSEETQAQVRIDQAIVRSLFQELVEEWSDLQKYRNYYDGEQALVYGSDKFKEFFPNFEGFEDNWCQVVVDAVADKVRLIGIDLDEEDSSPEDGDGEGEIQTENSLSEKIWNVFRDNNINEQQGDLTEGVLVEGRAAVIVWPDEDLGVRIDWNPAQLVKVRYSEDDYRKIDFAVKRWETPAGVIRVNVYDSKEVRKYVETRTTTLPANTRSGIKATIPEMPPSFSLTPRFVEGEPWPLAHPFGRPPVVPFDNKRGSELSDVIPLQDGINYLLVAGFVTADFEAVRQRVFFTHLKEPVGGWKNTPGRIWHLPPLVDADGKALHGEAYEFSNSDLNQFRQFVEMLLQHLALTSKTPVRMFFKSDRGGRGDAPSGDSQLIEDEPLLDKCRDRQDRMGNRWFEVAKLVAKGLGVETPLRGEMIWEDPRSKYSSALLDDAVKMAITEKGLGLPIQWVITRLGLSPEDLSELQDMLKVQIEKAEALQEELMEQNSQPPVPPTPPAAPDKPE